MSEISSEVLMVDLHIRIQADVVSWQFSPLMEFKKKRKKKKRSPPGLTLGGKFNKGKGDKTRGRPGCSLCRPSFCFPRRADGHLSAFTCREAMIFARLAEHPAKQYFTC